MGEIDLSHLVANHVLFSYKNIIGNSYMACIATPMDNKDWVQICYETLTGDKKSDYIPVDSYLKHQSEYYEKLRTLLNAISD